MKALGEQSRQILDIERLKRLAAKESQAVLINSDIGTNNKLNSSLAQTAGATKIAIKKERPKAND